MKNKTRQIIDEILDLRESEYVKLALAYEAHKEALTQMRDELKALEHRGMQLAACGVTLDGMEDALRVLEDLS